MDRDYAGTDAMDIVVHPEPSSWSPSNSNESPMYFDQVVPAPQQSAYLSSWPSKDSAHWALKAPREDSHEMMDVGAGDDGDDDAWAAKDAKDAHDHESGEIEVEALASTDEFESNGRDQAMFFASIADPEQALRFPEFHKIRNALLPILNEETTLDSDLRCLLRSVYNSEKTRVIVEVYLPAFEAGLEHMRAQETYFADLYGKCPGNFGAAEIAIIRCRLKWARMRLHFKRRLLYILLNGGDQEAQAFREDQQSNATFTSPFPQSASMSKGSHDVGKGPANAAENTTFIASGVVKPRSNFSKAAKSQLRAWFENHKDNPYPSDEEKETLARQTGLTPSQVSTWFINERMRNWRRKRKHAAAGGRVVGPKALRHGQ
ncbi:Homeobox protein, putative [Hondaea fermentalgiana]|uniref:Homeobox protein, putative n=1 Tax=Hondaea fermentalgiana TaxID=2315210 RepID=A0A2R5GF35_9STRA|nr:Homeobox protein, putative [Hondaea fermentalgiana]|eukprot:GBG27223.1 Homeobox protein, putative [Hondaea fermentalgiana]